MKYLLIILLALPLYAHDGDWEELNLKTYSHCFDFDQFYDPLEVNPALLSTICNFTSLTGRTYIHHSDYRPLRSEHHYGNALDFRVNSYAGMNRRQRLIQYRKDLGNLQEFLNAIGLTDKVGLGIYPQSPNPFFHLDLRGKKGRWAEINNEYVGWHLGIEWA